MLPGVDVEAEVGAFRTILEKKGQVGRTLRLMHRCGVLGRYLPEFGALDCLEEDGLLVTDRRADGVLTHHHR